MLTKKQKELYDYLTKYISENYISPSFEEMKEAVDDFEIGVVNTGKEGFCKIITMGNVINMERLQEIISSPKMIEWDKNHNNTDIIYSLERIN